MIDLLGDDALGYADGQLSALDYDYLPAAKRQELSFILSDFGELRSETLREARTVFLPEDREILALRYALDAPEVPSLHYCSGSRFACSQSSFRRYTRQVDHRNRD